MASKEDALKAIDQFFSDTSRSAEETLAGIMELSDDCNMKIEALQGDLQELDPEA